MQYYMARFQSTTSKALNNFYSLATPHFISWRAEQVSVHGPMKAFQPRAAELLSLLITDTLTNPHESRMSSAKAINHGVHRTEPRDVYFVFYFFSFEISDNKKLYYRKLENTNKLKENLKHL